MITVKQLQFNVLGVTEGGANKLFGTPARNSHPAIGGETRLTIVKRRPNALDFSLYIARQMSSIVECCRDGVAKRSRLFTRLGTQHSTDVLFDE